MKEEESDQSQLQGNLELKNRGNNGDSYLYTHRIRYRKHGLLSPQDNAGSPMPGEISESQG